MSDELNLLHDDEASRDPNSREGSRGKPISTRKLQVNDKDASPSASPGNSAAMAMGAACLRCGGGAGEKGPTSFAHLLTSNTMIASVAVFLYEGLAYNVIYLGRVLPAINKDGLITPFFFLFNIFWGLAVWSYVQAHRTDPGVVPKEWHDFVSEVGGSLTVVPARLEWQPGRATLCRRCSVPRPERAHHCHICNVCILRMDHHCPWIRNCVGFRNHKFFLLLIMYTATAAMVGLATSAPDLYVCTVSLLLHQGKDLLLQLSDIIVFLVFGILDMLFLALLIPMLTTHLPLASQNITSIESHYESATEANPFDQETTMSNLAQIFGSLGLDWLIPVQPLHPVGDGVTFLRMGGLRRGDNDVEATMDRRSLWRRHYSVRDSVTSLRRSSRESESSPLATLAAWWQGASPDEKTVSNRSQV